MNRSLLAAGHGELIGAFVVPSANPRARRVAPGARRTTSGEPGPPQPQPSGDDCARGHPSSTLFARVLAMLRAWQRRNRDRREFAALDDRMLRDIGLTRYDVSGR